MIIKVNKIASLLALMVILTMASCSDRPAKKIEYIVVNVTTDHVEGFKHNMREAETGRPTFVHFPEIRFNAGDRVIMKRTRKAVTFELAVQPRY